MAKQSYRKLRNKAARDEQLTVTELRRFNRLDKYNRQAQKLRATNAFGTLFKGEKMNLQYPEKWSSADKARINKYVKELGPLLAAPTKTKRYFRPDHLKSAIEVSPQEQVLPGQKAALFPVDEYREDVVIVFDRKHRPTVTRDGIKELKINFDLDALVEDSMAELKRVLADAPGQFFKFVVGTNESKQTMTAEGMIDAMERMIADYDPDEKPLDAFLFGIKAYPNVRSSVRMRKRDVRHGKAVAKRQRKRLSERSKQERQLSRAELRSIKITGRAGRVK